MAGGTPDRFVKDLGTLTIADPVDVTLLGPFPLQVESNEDGVWDYIAGVSGLGITIPPGGRVLGIAAATTQPNATVSINGGDAIPIPIPSSGVGAVELAPRADLIAPTLDFVNTDSYLVEFVT